MPKSTVGAIIYKIQDGKCMILLTKRNIEPFRDLWCLPGGHIEEYENSYDAVIREVKEETNMDFSPEFFYYVDEIFPEKNIHNVALMFCGKATNKPKADPKEVSDIKWCTIEEALKINLAFAHNDVVRQFASEGKYL